MPVYNNNNNIKSKKYRNCFYLLLLLLVLILVNQGVGGGLKGQSCKISDPIASSLLLLF